MTDHPPVAGKVAWFDLTVEDAKSIRDFYQHVVGWNSAPVPVGDYEDFTMQSGDEAVAGICHAKGINANLPPQWLIYVTVLDLQQSIEACRQRGGEVLVEPREAGSGRCAVIRDPAGACMALYEN